MKLAMIPGEQCHWLKQWGQIAPNVWGSSESERELAIQRVLFQQLLPKSRF